MPEDVKQRKFKTLFEADEINGKIYPLGGGVTGMDMPTQHYLESIGRIESVTDEQFGDLPGAYSAEELDAKAKEFEKSSEPEHPGDIDAELLAKEETERAAKKAAKDQKKADDAAAKEKAKADETEAKAKAARERLAETLAEVEKGNVPDDLKAEGGDGLISREDLDTKAGEENVTVKGSWQKAEVAAAIMIARADKEAPKA